MLAVFQHRIFWVALVLIIMVGLARAHANQPQPATVQLQQGLALEVADAHAMYQEEKLGVFVTLTKQSAAEFLQFTKVHLGQVVEVLIDGGMTVAARINEPIAGDILWVGDFASIEQATSTARKLKANEAQLAIRANGPVVSHPTNSGISQPLWTVPQSPASAPSQTPAIVPLHPLPQPPVR